MLDSHMTLNPMTFCQRALSRWDDEGGSIPPPMHEAAACAPVMTGPAPYRSTPVFDQKTLPAGLRKEHRTKAGVWGVINVFEGKVRYCILDPVSETVLDVDHPGLVYPEQPHRVEPIGAMTMRVDFYNCDPMQ